MYEFWIQPMKWVVQFVCSCGLFIDFCHPRGQIGIQELPIGVFPTCCSSLSSSSSSLIQVYWMNISHNPLVWLDCFMMLPIVVILTLQLRDCLMVCSILLIGFSIVPMIYFNWFLSLLIMSLFNLLFLFFLHCFRCLLFLFVVSIKTHSDYE